MARRPTTKGPKQVEALTHARRARPTSRRRSCSRWRSGMEEMQPVKPVHYPRAETVAGGRDARARCGSRSADRLERGAHRLTPGAGAQLQETGEVEIGDAQLVWRGKDRQDWSDLVVNAPPLYIQEKVHPKAIIDDLKRRRSEAREARTTTRPTCSPTSTASDPESAAGVLPARPALVEPHDPRRQPAGDGEPRRARGPARQGAVHLFRPALRHQVQFATGRSRRSPRREGRQARATSRASRSR